jgi:hypothetical protein
VPPAASRPSPARPPRRSDAPLRETVTLSRLGPDLSPLPPRRLELYINSLSSEEGEEAESGAPPTFYTSEMCRQVGRGGSSG